MAQLRLAFGLRIPVRPLNLACTIRANPVRFVLAQARYPLALFHGHFPADFEGCDSRWTRAVLPSHPTQLCFNWVGILNSPWMTANESAE